MASDFNCSFCCKFNVSHLFKLSFLSVHISEQIILEIDGQSINPNTLELRGERATEINNREDNSKV